MQCLQCGKKLSVLRQIHDQEFCSAAHRKAYLKKQDDLALDYLISSKPRYKRASTATVESAPEVPVEAIPLPANFVAADGAAARLGGTPVPGASSDWAYTQPVLPALVRISPGKLLSGRFSRVSLRVTVAPGRIENVCSSPLEFPVEPARIPARLMRPVWMDAEPAAAVERRNPGFANVTLRRVRIEPGIMHPAASPAFAIPPLFLNPESALSRPLLRLATAVHGPAEVTRRRVSTLPVAEAVWNSRGIPPHVPQAVLTPAECQLRVGERIRPAPSPHNVFPPLRQDSIAWNRVSEPPQVSQAVFSAHRAFLRMALRIPADLPRHVTAETPAVGGPAALIWRAQLQLPSGRFPVIRAQFSSLGCDNAAETSRATYWQLIPAAKRRLISGAPLVLAMLAVIARLVTLAPVRSARESVFERIHERAAIELQDDFRSGLGQWTGVSGWAETWSYDSTGFARPGHLALFASSMRLADYRFDFLTQIDKAAVSWVFRALDVHNYYVTKLLQSKSAGTAGVSMVRYAVIGGREGPKTRLPLPVAAPGRRTFWVRQEIRGADFTTYVEGRVVDTWSDSSLARGGIGFFSDSGESAYIRSVQVAENDDLLGRLCSLIGAADRK